MTDPAAQRVSVIVLSWNALRFLEACLASVLAQTWPAVELIVVDYASEDDTASFVKKRFPSAILVESPVNLGFCGGNNLGLTRAHGAYVLFLNADTILDPNYLEEALKPFAAEGRVGMVAGKVLRFDRLTLDTTGQLLSRSRRVKERGYGEPDRGQYEEPGEVFSVCGAVALYRRSVVDAISVDDEFFDSDFFAFGEDFDAGWRAQRLGWSCRYQPSAVALHFRGGTQKENTGRSKRPQMTRRPPEIQAHIVKNRYLMMIKNETPGSFLVHLPFILAWDLVIWAYLIIFSPGTVPILWTHRQLVGRALDKRRRCSHKSRSR